MTFNPVCVWVERTFRSTVWPVALFKDRFLSRHASSLFIGDGLLVGLSESSFALLSFGRLGPSVVASPRAS